MLKLTVEIERYAQNADKTGWRYIFLPNDVVAVLKPTSRRSFRVKGMIDGAFFEGLSLLPVKGDGYILPINGEIRKRIHKDTGDKVSIAFEADLDFKIVFPEDLAMCLAQEEEDLTFFLSFNKSHQNHFINWLNSAKTEETRAKRLEMIVKAMALKQDYGTMIRSNRKI